MTDPEETLNELLKAESNIGAISTETNPDYFNPKQTAFDYVSPREMQIIKQVIQGNKNKEIAKQLQISIDTVKKHLNNVYKKLGVKSRFELMAKIHHHKNKS